MIVGIGNSRIDDNQETYSTQKEESTQHFDHTAAKNVKLKITESLLD